MLNFSSFEVVWYSFETVFAERPYTQATSIFRIMKRFGFKFRDALCRCSGNCFVQYIRLNGEDDLIMIFSVSHSLINESMLLELVLRYHLICIKEM